MEQAEIGGQKTAGEQTMSRKIEGYILVKESNHENFTIIVNEWIAKGWQPYGALIFQPYTGLSCESYMQAMVLYGEATNE